MKFMRQKQKPEGNKSFCTVRIRES